MVAVVCARKKDLRDGSVLSIGDFVSFGGCMDWCMGGLRWEDLEMRDHVEAHVLVL